MARSAVKSKAEVRKLLGNTRNLLEDLRMSRREASNQLRKNLTQARSSVKSDVRQMLRRFHKTRQELGVGLKKVREAHQELASTKRVRSQAVATPLKSKTPAAKEKIRDLETEMLAAIKEHPKGITLAGIADSLGVAPVVLGRVSKNLLDKGKIRKNEKLYFPAAIK
jgi:DNA-binding transcriptional MerR regulator